jgi:ubiquinone/menaquinone biosynthesis C-methylase UbiE
MCNSVKKNIKQVYNKYAREFDQKIASLTLYDASYDFLLNLIPDDGSILDLGCGPGNVSAYLKIKKPHLSITGIDISEEMVAIAREKLSDGQFMVKDICETRFGVQFDCAICAFAIPYLNLDEAGRVVANIRRSLRDNGIFYISFMDGQRQGYEKTSFTENDELFIYFHPRKAVMHILAEQDLSVTKTFEIDYPEMDGSITAEIIYIGKK